MYVLDYCYDSYPYYKTNNTNAFITSRIRMKYIRGVIHALGCKVRCKVWRAYIHPG